MLAGLTGCKDVSTVFETGNLRIFFMTKHIALVEACRQISEEQVFQSIISAARCMDLLGIKGEKIAVAALNPHSGEHGLMGNEETLCIEPAIKRAHGPDQC